MIQWYTPRTFVVALIWSIISIVCNCRSLWLYSVSSCCPFIRFGGVISWNSLNQRDTRPWSCLPYRRSHVNYAKRLFCYYYACCSYIWSGESLVILVNTCVVWLCCLTACSICSIILVITLELQYAKAVCSIVEYLSCMLPIIIGCNIRRTYQWIAETTIMVTCSRKNVIPDIFQKGRRWPQSSSYL